MYESIVKLIYNGLNNLVEHKNLITKEECSESKEYSASDVNNAYLKGIEDSINSVKISYDIFNEGE